MEVRPRGVGSCVSPGFLKTSAGCARCPALSLPPGASTRPVTVKGTWLPVTRCLVRLEPGIVRYTAGV